MAEENHLKFLTFLDSLGRVVNEGLILVKALCNLTNVSHSSITSLEMDLKENFWKKGICPLENCDYYSKKKFFFATTLYLLNIM